MSTQGNNNLASEIISSNFYLTTSTCSENIPWSATVMYWVDDENNFYFVSAKNSRHVMNIRANPIVGIAIYHSQQKLGTGKGVQFSAIAEIIEDYESILKSIEFLVRSRAPNESPDIIPLTANTWTENGRVVVKLVIQGEIYINCWNGQIDTREPVILPPLDLLWFNPNGTK